MENKAKLKEIRRHIRDCKITFPLFRKYSSEHENNLMAMMANDYY